jgi:protoporphyrinogen oxidase
VKSVVIIGAGPAGLTAAAELAGSGFNVAVLEQDPYYVGGISRTVYYKGFRFDIGGHRFFSKNNEITKWWHDRLPTDFLNVRRQSRIFYRKKLYDYPLRLTNALSNLGICTSAACICSYVWSHTFRTKPEISFEDWVSNRFGRKLFSIFFKSYTEKVWGISCSQISADWASQRIKGLSLKNAIYHSLRGRRSDGEMIKTLIDEFQYPRLGPGMMWEKTRDDLIKAGARICMGKKVVELVRCKDSVIAVRTQDVSGAMEDWSADAFILSMPLRDSVLCMKPAFAPDVQAVAQNLKYRDFITVALIVKGENLFPDNWIYIHDPHVRVGRVQNFNNWSREMVPTPGVTCLGLEYFCTVGDQFWALSDLQLIETAKQEIATIGLVVAEDIIDACVVRIEKAYPVYDSGYQENVMKIRTALSTLKNLQVVGRNGMHKYNNQDHSMMTALLAARNLKGDKNDVWRVNTDAEYHEEGNLRNSGRLAPSVVDEGRTGDAS